MCCPCRREHTPQPLSWRGMLPPAGFRSAPPARWSRARASAPKRWHFADRSKSKQFWQGRVASFRFPLKEALDAGCSAREPSTGLFLRVRLKSSVPHSQSHRGGALIPRYTRPEMGRIWSDENRFRTWLAVEVAATETLAEVGMVPKAAAHAIRERADFRVERIHEIEAEVRHDVIAFTTAVAEIVGPDARWLHYGLTSNDVVDTAQALLIKQASALIAKDLQTLADVLERRAWEFKDTPMVGRTHGIHAEPITFGFKIANWYSETQRNRHAQYLATLAVISFSHDTIATEIRHLQRTEVREAEEFFSEKQKGSSAMPHKRNPFTCEQISGLSRVVRSNAQAGFENVALWHERDISHSSAERVILPDSTTLLDYLLNKTSNLIDTMFVYPERMLANLESTRGLIFSGQLLLDLVEQGISREDAYRMVQAHAMRAWKEGLDFHKLVLADANITRTVPRKKVEYAFDLKRQLKNVDKIFARVFGKGKPRKALNSPKASRRPRAR